MDGLAQRQLALGVTGSIAAYKALFLLRLLRRAGAIVTPVLTPSATAFVGAASFSALAGRPCVLSPWAAAAKGEIGHVELGQRAEVLLVAPASAHALATYAHGLAGDVLSSLWLSCRGIKVVAPAMESAMWEADATQANVACLKARGVVVVPPQVGALASGGHGNGRLAEPAAIVEYLRRALALAELPPHRSLRGQRVLVTAGPTREYLDPVRFLSNPSSGRMGLALARAAWRRGAHVELICGPTQVRMPGALPTAQVHRVTTCGEMLAKSLRLLPRTDLLLMAAAPSDARAAQPRANKVKKDDAGFLQPALRRTDDILLQLAGRKIRPFTVGFAAETHADLAAVQAKRRRKNLDLLVYNAISAANPAFDVATNQATLVPRDGAILALPSLSKAALAEAILDAVAEARRTDGLDPRP